MSRVLLEMPATLRGGARLFEGACSGLPTAAAAAPLVTHLTHEVDRSRSRAI